MRKIFILIATIFVLSLFTTSCKKDDKKNDDGGTDTQVVDTTMDDLNYVDEYIKKNTPTKMVESTELISSVEGYSDVAITYTLQGEVIEEELPRNAKKKMDYELQYELKKNDKSKSGTLNITVYPKSLEYVANNFISQVPKELAENLDYLVTDYLGLYTITWSSGDTSVLDNDGKYIKPTLDTKVVISFKVTLNDDKAVNYEGNFEITVVGVTDEEKLNKVVAWLNNEIETELWVDKNMNLPKVDPTFGVELTWTTTNPDIMTTDGVVTRYVYDRYVEAVCTIKVGNFTKKLTYWVKVLALDTSTMSDLEILDNFLTSLGVSELRRVNFNINSDYTNITQSYNFINFYNNEWLPVTDYYAPSGASNRPGTKRSIKFITVHDTANNRQGATALMHAKYVYEGGGGTSFHYVVGNDGIYHLIPNDEVAYHAGDGTQYQFKLYDSGVKALTRTANITITDDNYFAFNGVKSKIKIPTDTVVRSISSAGLYYEIGANGNYWLNEHYYNKTYQFISNRGGNNNSIGIETCVDAGSDYFVTYLYNANNVARLCNDYKIPVDCVMQHNNFSGKPCPNAIRQTGTWQPFRDYVSQILFGMKHFKGLTFEWHSTSDILSSKGFVNRTVGDVTEITYGVVVKKGDTAITSKDFKTTLNKTYK